MDGRAGDILPGAAIVVLLLMGQANYAQAECDATSGPSGSYECVHFSLSYDKPQYATCLTKAYIEQKSKGRHTCRDQTRTFCFYQCMLEFYDLDEGIVNSDCACSTLGVVTTTTRSPQQTTLSPQCFSPSGEDCSWYRNCLERKFPCNDSSDIYAVGYAERFCTSFLDRQSSLSHNGSVWMNAVRKCLQVSLVPVLRFFYSSSCMDIKQRAFDSHAGCYLQPYQGAPSVCDLPPADFWTIFWTIRSAFSTFFSQSLYGLMQVMKGCASVRLKELENKMRYLVINLRLPDSSLYRSKRSVDAQPKDMVHEALHEMGAKPDRTKRSAENIAKQAMSTLRERVKRQAPSQWAGESSSNLHYHRLAEQAAAAVADQLSWDTQGVAWFASGQYKGSGMLEVHILLADARGYSVTSASSASSSMTAVVAQAAQMFGNGNLVVRLDGRLAPLKKMRECGDLDCQQVLVEVTEPPIFGIGCKRTSGVSECIPAVPAAYDKPQYATCLTQTYIQLKSKGSYKCVDQSQTRCLYQCMLELYGEEDGRVTSDCVCDPSNPNPQNTSLAPQCLSPSGEDCGWYRDCLQRKISCGDSSDDYAIGYAERFCTSFLDRQSSLSHNGSLWMNAVRKCLQVSLVPTLRSFYSPTCADIKQRAFDSHADCYLQPYQGAPSVCDLPLADFWTIFWAIHSGFRTDFSQSLYGLMQVMKGCAAMPLEQLEDRMRSLVINLRLSDSTIYRFKRSVDALSADPLPDAVHKEDAKPERRKRTAENVAKEALSALKEQKMTERERLKRQAPSQWAGETYYALMYHRLADHVAWAISKQLSWDIQGVAWFASGQYKGGGMLEVHILLADEREYNVTSAPSASPNMTAVVTQAVQMFGDGSLVVRLDGRLALPQNMRVCGDLDCQQVLVEVTAPPFAGTACKRTSGEFECIPAIPGVYDKPQYATCLTETYIQLKSKGKYACTDQTQTHCFYQCMLELHGEGNGHVTSDCVCDSSDANTAPNPQGTPLALQCLSPSGEDCGWYRDCLKRKISCDDSSDDYAIGYAERFCTSFLDRQSSLFYISSRWMNAVRKCLQVSLVPTLRSFYSPTCADIKQRAFDSHADCYLQPYEGAPSVCDLPLADFWTIFWTIRSAFNSDFSQSLYGLMQVTGSCASKKFEYLGDTMRSLVINLHLPDSSLYRSKRSADALAEEQLHTSQLEEDAEVERSKRRAENIAEDARSNLKEHVMTERIKRQAPFQWAGESGSALHYHRLAEQAARTFADRLNWGTQEVVWFASGNYVYNSVLEVHILLADAVEYGVNSSVSDHPNMTAVVLHAAQMFEHGNVRVSLDGKPVGLTTLIACEYLQCQRAYLNATYASSAACRRSSETAGFLLFAMLAVVFTGEIMGR